MSIDNGTGRCAICKRGRLTMRTEEVSFHQRTDKGHVFCCAVIPVAVCDGCGSKTWDDAAEATIEAAVRREYDKLP